jgi:hypothetical protein
MAVKLPADTWKSQVITLSGLRDNVYSKINGALVGYIKDGKFVQTIDELPKLDPKKKPEQDKEFAANIKKISALNSIPPLEQDAAYYRDQAENINKTPQERATAKAEYERLTAEIEAKRKEAGVASTEIKEAKAEKTKVSDAKRLKEIQTEFTNTKERYDILIDPLDKTGRGPEFKSKLDSLAKEYSDLSANVSGGPVLSPTVSFTKLSGNKVPTFGAPRTSGSGRTNVENPAQDAITNTPDKPGTPATPAASSTPSATLQTPPPASSGAGKGGIGSDSNKKNKDKKPKGNAKETLDSLLEKTEFWYDLPDYIFNTVDGLGEILVTAVDEEWDNAKFLAKAQQTPWWQKNSGPIRERIVNREKYNELRAAGEDVSKSDYGVYLGKQMRFVKDKARKLGGVELTDEQAQSISQKIYDGFLDDDPLAINSLITPFIKKVSSIAGKGNGQTGFSGEALQNYQTLQGIAKANGFNLSNILPNISSTLTGGDLETAVLQKLANGELDINRISQDARMLAAQGQPQYVRDLLNQGYDLQDIYAPYRSQMAAILELDANQIDLNDPTLRMGITDKGDMNLYDFNKMLRQDSRWQYTGQAKEDVSTAALGVLRDFGFQG